MSWLQLFHVLAAMGQSPLCGMAGLHSSLGRCPSFALMRTEARRMRRSCLAVCTSLYLAYVACACDDIVRRRRELF